ncbi:MAG: ABC transporter substrate-binding protein [Phycisphaerae bacterium]|nr:ABC transporter substrate-binding protein [Phycisphaerae bacterium]
MNLSKMVSRMQSLSLRQKTWLVTGPAPGVTAAALHGVSSVIVLREGQAWFRKKEMGMTRSEQIGLGRHTEFVAFLVVCCLFLGGCAEKKAKVYHVGILSGAEPFASIADGFKTRMAELGYVEGKNIVYDLQKVNADPAGEQRVAERFVADGVDLIFAFPTEPAAAAKSATRGTDIPVVFAMAGIEGNDLVKSVREPGGNITGVRFPSPELTAKRFEFLRELVPHVKRVYLIYDPDYPTAPFALGVLRPAAAALAVTLVEDPVRNVEELQVALEKRTESDDIGIDAILIMPDILDNSPDGFGAIVKFANEHRLPVGGGMDFTADLGAMFSFVPDNAEMGKLAAPLADKILRGAPASTLPVVTPESHLRLNYEVIRDLGLDVSEGLLSRADEIIR